MMNGMLRYRFRFTIDVKNTSHMCINGLQIQFYFASFFFCFIPTHTASHLCVLNFLNQSNLAINVVALSMFSFFPSSLCL
mmetsp:Transcript_2383/g.6418  ORF Transcript_2383/g.6418 Transcript_2383/m.6418 type:complete len:80 (-) Transcript_2383:577-816(-)